MDEYYQRIKNYWMEKSPKDYWGDDLDVRFLLIKKLSNLRNKRVLDIGCGMGVVFKFLDASNEKYGIDISPIFVDQAKKNIPEAEFKIADATKLPYKNETFDIVLLVNVIEAISSIEQKTRVKEAVRVLKRSGVIYLTTPNKLHPYYLFKKVFFPWEIRALLINNGLEIIDLFTYNQSILPSRWITGLPFINQILEYTTQIPIINMFGRGTYIKARKI